MPRIILDAVAVADLLHHLQVEHGALPQALRFDQLALFLQFLMPPVELRHDAGHGRVSGLVGLPTSYTRSLSSFSLSPSSFTLQPLPFTISLACPFASSLSILMERS